MRAQTRVNLTSQKSMLFPAPRDLKLGTICTAGLFFNTHQFEHLNSLKSSADIRVNRHDEECL